MGAEPGFQSEAITKEVPASSSLRAGAKGSPNPIEAPGSITGMTSPFESKMIS